MNSEANSEAKSRSYSVRELAEMGLPGYPGTERAWLDRVKNGNWVYVEFKGQGRGGIRREYTPPPEVQALIDARQRGELPAAAPVRQPVVVTEEDYNTEETVRQFQCLMGPSATDFIDPARLREAVILAARSEAVQPLSPDQRADMILSFYQHLSKPAQ